MNRCSHCNRVMGRAQTLCWKCGTDPAARGDRLPPPEPSDDELDAICSGPVASPDWTPAACPVGSAEYCRVVRERERKGLPARHPGDPQPDLS